MKVPYFLYTDDELLLRDLSKKFVADQLSIENLIALQPDAPSYSQGSKRTKRVKSKRKLESITHQNTLKQIEEQEQLEGKNQIEDQNEEESDTSSVSATMPDLKSSTSNGEEEDEDFEHDNVFPPESSVRTVRNFHFP